MAIWTLNIAAGSGLNSGVTSVATSSSPPGDFDGATINSVLVVGSPTVTSDGTTDDAITIRWRIENTGGTGIYGGIGTDAGSMCFAVIGDSVSSDVIDEGSAVSPAPTIAVAADWDEIGRIIDYVANMKNDGETVSWSRKTPSISCKKMAGRSSTWRSDW